MTDDDSEAAGYVLYDGYDKDLDSSLTPELEAALSRQGATADPDTGIVITDAFALEGNCISIGLRCNCPAWTKRWADGLSLRSDT